MVNFNHSKLAFKVIYVLHNSDDFNDDFNEAAFQKSNLFVFLNCQLLSYYI